MAVGRSIQGVKAPLLLSSKWFLRSLQHGSSLDEGLPAASLSSGING